MLTADGFVQIVTLFGIPYDDDYFNKYGGILTIIFSALPWNPFAKAVQDLGQATTASPERPVLGITWSGRDSYCVRCSLPLYPASPCVYPNVPCCPVRALALPAQDQR